MGNLAPVFNKENECLGGKKMSCKSVKHSLSL